MGSVDAQGKGCSIEASDSACGARRTRESGLELLRILSMMFIIGGHLVSYTQEIETLPPGLPKVLSELAVGGAQVGVVCFFAISAWFLCAPIGGMSPLSSLMKAVQLWLSTVFWTLPLGALSALTGGGCHQCSWERLLFPCAHTGTSLPTQFLS